MNLARRKSNSILYNTAIKENAWNFQSDLKHLLLENSLLQWIFPELPKDEKSYSAMTKNRIEHGRVRMDFSSMDSTQASRHYYFICNDDLENEKNYQTEGQRLDLINAFMYQQSVLTKIKSRGVGMDIFVGTPYHIQGLTWKVRNDKTYSRLEIPCFKNHRKEDGVSFPERFTVDDFDIIRSRQNTQVFCLPQESPILMADWTLRPISEVKEGDEVIGFTVGFGHGQKKEARFVKSKVTGVCKTQDYVYKCTMESGDIIKCTKNHNWFSGRSEVKSGRKPYHPPRVGQNIKKLLDIKEETDINKLKAWSYLGGIIDGEGSCTYHSIFISQSPTANWPIYRKILDTLDYLGIKYKNYAGTRNTEHFGPKGQVIKNGDWNFIVLHGGKQLFFNLIRYTGLAKKEQLYKNMAKHCHLWTNKDKVLSIKMNGYHKKDVYGLETETGNYIAWGYLSSNSSQYDLRPLSEEDALCPESWIQYWTHPPDPYWREMIVDPGGADPTSKDPTGITIVDTDTNGNMYIVLAEEYYFQPIEFMDKIKELKDNYAPDSIRIEKEKYWTTIADIFQHKFPELNISYAEHKGRNKDVRIWRLKQWFQGKRIFLNKNMKESKFFAQLTEYPSVAHDDMLDSLAYHLDYRRVPDPYIIHRLPSGKPFVPNIAADFEEEMNLLFARIKGNDQARENDHVW